MKLTLYFGLIASLGLLMVTVLRLTWVRHSYYSMLARDNKIVEKTIPAARGSIVDRKDRVLAESVYQYFKDNDGVRIYLNQGEYEGKKFEGSEALFELKRHYLYGESAGSLTGYVGRISEAELKNDPCRQKVEADDVIGRGGLEESFECQLRGTDGKRLIEVDARGKYVRELGRQEPESGDRLKLSIDAYWQEKVYKLMEGKRGAVIISNPKNGKILVMVSSPSIDPNVFAYDINNETIKRYLNDNEGLPMLNRTIAGKYHPGSVFKVSVAAAGLETGVVDKNTQIEDTGVIKVGEYSYNNWLWTKRGGTDGMVNLVKALKRSNDIYFYRLGEKLGLERIDQWATKFGYGKKTMIELPGELAGIVPDEKWKIETKGEKWFLGNTYHLAIGQGDLSVTPLQVNQMTNVIANGGKKCRPSLLADSKIECEEIGVDDSTVRTITEGMREACISGGTAWPLFNFKTKLACKTGTAEVGDGSKDTHAWLTAFAPLDDPEISITVLVERGGEGSDVAAPIVGDILKEWFEETNTIIPRYTPTPGN